MAWNEPGGSGGKDPWGRKNEQGPPDLDEVVRKFQDKLGGVFGGRGGGSTASAFGGFFVILVVVAVIWALSGVYIIDEGKRGVILRFGAYHATTEPGIHWYPRFIDSLEKVDVESVRSLELGYRQDEALMLTQDENIIDIKFAVQYRIKGGEDGPRNFLFNVREPDETLRQVTESAVREVVGKSKMDFIITGGRSEIVASARDLLQKTLDDYETGLVVINLTMQDAQPPQEVQGAFADAVKAREDEQRLINEAQAYANDILPKARGSSARIIEEANAYQSKVIAEAEGETARFSNILTEYRKAPKVTRERLYLDAMESVLYRTSKVLVDTEGGNNLLYLPLDKLMQRPAVPPAAFGAPEAQGTESAQPPEQQTRNGRIREGVRQREVR